MRDRKHEAWLKRVKAAGRSLVGYACPVCTCHIDSLLPDPGDIYSTMVSCPNCGELHFRVVRANGAVIVDGKEVEPC